MVLTYTGNPMKPPIVQIIVLFSLFFLLPPVPLLRAADLEPPVGQSKQPLENTQKEPIPGGQTKSGQIPSEGISAEIFGQKGGRIHPFVMVETVFTDNLFATTTNTKNDFVTTAAPGIWLAFPANRERLLKLDTTTTASGGLNLSRIKPDASRRYQTYLLYSPEFVFYADHSHQNHTNHRVEGLFQYNFNSGLSFDLINLFNDREEIAGDGQFDTLYTHQDNLFDLIASYTTSSGKITVELDYSNYHLSYDDDPVRYRDRTDNSLGASLFYRFWPKTSLFIEYNYADIEFDTGTLNDNVENRFYGGVTWEMTAKSKGTLKLGHTEKDFDSPLVEDQDGFSVELQTLHNFTAKRAIQANGYRRFHESDQAGASSFLSTGIDITILQRFTRKWSGTFNIFYELNDYYGNAREDNYYGLSPALRFKPRKWLFFDMGYYYYRNDSNISVYDYEANHFLIRATIAL